MPPDTSRTSRTSRAPGTSRTSRAPGTSRTSGAPGTSRTTRATDDLFRILADPTRRRILDLLAERGNQNVGELAAEFPGLVPSGISKHLMALRAAGLVHSTKDGRQRWYHLDAAALESALAPWLATYERYWAGALDRLRDLAEREQGHD